MTKFKVFFHAGPLTFLEVRASRVHRVEEDYVFERDYMEEGALILKAQVVFIAPVSTVLCVVDMESLIP